MKILTIMLMLTTNIAYSDWWFHARSNLQEYNDRGFITFQTPIQKSNLDCNAYSVSGKNPEIKYDFDWILSGYPVQFYITQLAEKCVVNNRDGELIYMSSSSDYYPDIKSGADLNFSRCTLKPRKGPNDRSPVDCSDAEDNVWNGYLEQMCNNQWSNYPWETYVSEVSSSCLEHPTYLAKKQEVEDSKKMADFVEECNKDEPCSSVYESINFLVKESPLSKFKTDVLKLNQERLDAVSRGKGHLVDEIYSARDINSWLVNIEKGRSIFTSLASKYQISFTDALTHVAPGASDFISDFDGTLSEYKSYLELLEGIYERKFKKVKGSFRAKGRFRTYSEPELKSVTIDWSEKQEVQTTLKKDYSRGDDPVTVTIKKPKVDPRFNYKIKLTDPDNEKPRKRVQYQAISSCEELNRRLPKDLPTFECGEDE